ncbi:MAG: M1 family metallopeptidase [Phycisphaerales bacterium]
MRVEHEDRRARDRRCARTGNGWWSVALCLAACAGPASAQPFDDPRIDSQSGRDILVYPPDRLFDYVHMKLEISIPDMSKPEFDAISTLTLAPIGTPRGGVTLDAGPGLSFASIVFNGVAATFEHDKEKEKLAIVFPSALAKGQAGTLVMTYHAEKAGGRGAGFTWSKDNPRTPEEDPMFHSQGQPESNHLWFPCHDFPNEKLTTEIVVTIPKGYDALSNGHLESIKMYPDGRSRLHWVQDKPHTNYLVSLIVGKFDVVNVGGPETARPGLWMPVYGPVGSGERIRDTFKRTPDMVALCEKLFDEPYPWDKYAQSIARDFAAGAMENTSATTFAPFAATARGSFLESVIVHELAHQWMGDLVSYKAWEHTWLGEGWANYSEAFWAEHIGGQDAYQQAVLAKRRSETGGDGRWFPRFPGMVSNRYGDPDEIFSRAGRDWVYDKGGFVIHMLRMRLGDETFWKGVALYIDRHKFQCAETDDFRRALEEASGQSLERFFDQWVKRPGFANVSLDYQWNPDEKTLRVVAEQTQQIDAANPAFAFTLPLDINMGEAPGGGTAWEFLDLETESRVAEATIKLDHKPTSISVDPFLTVLMKARVRQPLEAWLDVLEHGRTLASKWTAVEALGGFDEPAARAALLAFSAGRGEDDAIRQFALDAVAAIDLRVAPAGAALDAAAKK